MTSKILIVDDDRIFRSELRDALDGYEVIEASSGEEALAALRRAKEIGLVLLDVQMYGLNGIDILEKIKKTDPHLHVAIMTGHGSKDVAIDALKARADDFLEKPIAPKELINMAEDVLSKLDYGSIDSETADIGAKIEKVKRFVERNCFKKTTLGDAAQSAFLSPKYLSRIFKERVKKSFSEFKIGVKIGKAKELLSKRVYNVNQVSEKLGYENTESFIRQFKKLIGKTPTEFRKKIWREKEKKKK